MCTQLVKLGACDWSIRLSASDRFAALFKVLEQSMMYRKRPVLVTHKSLPAPTNSFREARKKLITAYGQQHISQTVQTSDTRTCLPANSPVDAKHSQLARSSSMARVCALTFISMLFLAYCCATTGARELAGQSAGEGAAVLYSASCSAAILAHGHLRY